MSQSNGRKYRRYFLHSTTLTLSGVYQKKKNKGSIKGKERRAEEKIGLADFWRGKFIRKEKAERN